MSCWGRPIADYFQGLLYTYNPIGLLRLRPLSENNDKTVPSLLLLLVIVVVVVQWKMAELALIGAREQKEKNREGCSVHCMYRVGDEYGGQSCRVLTYSRWMRNHHHLYIGWRIIFAKYLYFLTILAHCVIHQCNPRIEYYKNTLRNTQFR